MQLTNYMVETTKTFLKQIIIKLFAIWALCIESKQHLA